MKRRNRNDQAQEAGEFLAVALMLLVPCAVLYWIGVFLGLWSP